MRVVGAGFGRTGTLSLKAALERLGFGPCYHMAEVIAHPADVPVWHAATRGEPVDFAALLRGWGACVDWPACSFYREILAAYPDARVLLSVRDPARWHQSVLATIRRPYHLFPLRWFVPHLPVLGAASRMADELVWQRTFGGRVDDPAHAIAVYEAHIAAVKREIPADRLLVYDVREGWAPLCAFLGVPVPDEPFPHVNDTRTVQRVMTVFNVLAWAALLAPVALAAFLLAR